MSHFTGENVLNHVILKEMKDQAIQIDIDKKEARKTLKKEIQSTLETVID